MLDCLTALAPDCEFINFVTESLKDVDVFSITLALTVILWLRDWYFVTDCLLTRVSVWLADIRGCLNVRLRRLTKWYAYLVNDCFLFCGIRMDGCRVWVNISLMNSLIVRICDYVTDWLIHGQHDRFTGLLIVHSSQSAIQIVQISFEWNYQNSNFDSDSKSGCFTLQICVHINSPTDFGNHFILNFTIWPKCIFNTQWDVTRSK